MVSGNECLDTKLDRVRERRMGQEGVMDRVVTGGLSYDVLM